MKLKSKSWQFSLFCQEKAVQYLKRYDWNIRQLVRLLLRRFWWVRLIISISSQISSILHKPSHVPGRGGENEKLENCLATNFDIAVIRCLFVSKWSEEGIFWSVTYLHRRLKGLNFKPSVEPAPRKRSNSLPVPKIEITSHETSQPEHQDKLPDIAESKLESERGEERWELYRIQRIIE